MSEILVDSTTAGAWPLDSAPRSEQPRVRLDHRATTEGVMSERELTYGEAVKEAIAEEMRRDPRVFLIGEDVAEAGHPFKTLVGSCRNSARSGSSTRPF